MKDDINYNWSPIGVGEGIGTGAGIGCEEIDLGLFMKEEDWI